MWRSWEVIDVAREDAVYSPIGHPYLANTFNVQ